MQKMTPRQLREQIEAIDQELRELTPWEKKLITMRKRYLLDDERDVVDIIENGLRSGQGRPAYSDLDAFDDGWPGLRETRETIASLKERRALLVANMPSKSEVEERTRETAALAGKIRARARELAARQQVLRGRLEEVAHLALSIAEDAHRLWEDNASLDRCSAEADIPRPQTPRAETESSDLAAPLSVLLRTCFNGGEPCAIDPVLANTIRCAAGAGERTTTGVRTSVR